MNDNYLEPPENFAPEPTYGNCSTCEGKGLIPNEEFDLAYECDCPEYVCGCIERKEVAECWNCEGTGEVEEEVCDSCNHKPCSCDAQYDAWAGK
jgi:hypothetical protein